MNQTEGNIDGRTPLWPKLALNGPLSCQEIAFQLSNYHLLLDTIDSYHYVKNQTNQIYWTQRNPQRPLLGLKLALNGPLLSHKLVSDLSDHHWCDEIIVSYHHMQTQTNRINQSQAKQQRPLFGPKLALKSPFYGQQTYFQHLDHHYLLDIITLYHHMKNREKQMHFEHKIA